MDRHLASVLVGRVWCPLCYEGRRGRRGHRGHLGFREPPRGLHKGGSMAIPRRVGKNGKGPDWKVLAQEEFVWSFPVLCEFVASCSWEEGAVRTPGTLLLFTDQGQWRAALHDRDAGETLFCSSDSLEALLRSLEGHISQGSGEWRRDRKEFGKGGGKRS